MTAWTRRLRAFFGIEYALMLTYRAEILLWAVATCLPLIMLGVWSQAAASGDFVHGPAWMARYFIAVFLVRQVTIVWVIHHFEYLVVSGRLSPQLLLPVDPVWRYAVAHLAEQACRLPIVAVMLVGCLLLFPAAWRGDEAIGPWIPGFGALAGGVLACMAAFTLRFALQYTFGLFAFWVERVSAAHELVYLLILFLSGMVAPLEVWPAAARDAVLWTPFPWLVWFPAKLLMGEPAPVLRGFVTLGLWIAVLIVINRVVWRRGLKHYSGMGA